MGSSICRNDGERSEVFPVFAGEAHATTFRRSERGVLGGFDCFCPLPNPLPRGEGTNGRESQQWSDFTLSPWEREQNKLQGITTIVEFQSSDSLSPWERARERAKPFGMPLSRFSKNHLSKRIQTKEIAGYGYPTLFLNFKGLKNE